MLANGEHKSEALFVDANIVSENKVIQLQFLIEKTEMFWLLMNKGQRLLLLVQVL
jgi:hypothetical protein